MTPELDCTSWMASTLKLEKVAPPSSGSVVSAPSMAKTAAEPRWPLTANCCVKLAAPLVSVMVPAARRRSLLKSRSLRGRLDTSPVERRSPPLAWGETRSVATMTRSSCPWRSEEHTSELQSPCNLVCRLLLEKKKKKKKTKIIKKKKNTKKK